MYSFILWYQESNSNQREDFSKQEESEKWASVLLQWKANCLLLQLFLFLFMCGFGWLAFFWLESSRPHYPAPASLFVQHVTPFRHNKWGDCWGPGPRGKRPCISVINLLVPTLRQQEIADFSSFTLGQRTHSTQQVCIQNQLELIDSLWFNCCNG